mgnify:CR=1 FL=1
MTDTDQQVLQKVVVATDIALTSLECILPHTTGNLKEKLTLFAIEHRELQNLAEQLLTKHNIEPSRPCKMITSMANALTKRRLERNSSPNYVAHMIIKGTASGSNNLNSFLKTHSNTSGEYLLIAKDLLDLQSRMQTALVEFI